jgi:hypothetical protein
MVGQSIMKWPSADEDAVLDISREADTTLKHESLPADMSERLRHMSSVTSLSAPTPMQRVFTWETAQEYDVDADALMNEEGEGTMSYRHKRRRRF